MRDIRELLSIASEKSADTELRAGTWLVCELYELADANEPASGAPRYIRAPRRDVRTPDAGTGEWKKLDRWHYQPLTKYDGLFLRFARLADGGGLDADDLESEKNTRVALSWAHDYGVLGLTPSKKPGEWWGDPEGGTGDTVSAFAAEALVANSILRLFESATDPEGVDTATIASFATSPYEQSVTGTPEAAKAWAENQVFGILQAQLARHCYPQLYQRRADGRRLDGLGFRSLLGAMWLQMMWLWYADNPGRCRNPKCRRIIAFEPPQPPPSESKKGAHGKHRTHKNKEYCDKRCGNRHYYLRITKSKRQAGR